MNEIVDEKLLDSAKRVLTSRIMRGSRDCVRLGTNFEHVFCFFKRSYCQQRIALFEAL